LEINQGYTTMHGQPFIKIYNKYGWHFPKDLNVNIPCDENIKFRVRRMFFKCKLRDQECTSPAAPCRPRLSEVWTVAHYIFGIIIAVFPLRTKVCISSHAPSRLQRGWRVTAEPWVRITTHKHVYQFTRTGQKAPDYVDAHRSLQNCGSAVLTLHHVTLLAPRIWRWRLGFFFWTFVNPSKRPVWTYGSIQMNQPTRCSN
jgi:hypothetical protein